jgi:hypothetical protein
VEAAIQFEYEKTHGMLFPLQKKKTLVALVVVSLISLHSHATGSDGSSH